MKLKVEKRETKDKRTYYCLVLDLGYTEHIVSFNNYLCAEVLNMTVPQMYEEVVDSIEIMKKEV